MNPSFIEEEGIRSSSPMMSRTLSSSCFRSHPEISHPFSEGLDFFDMENFVEFSYSGNESTPLPHFVSDELEPVGGLAGSMPPPCQKPLNPVPNHPKSCSAEQMRMVTKEQIVSSPSSPSQFSDEEDDWEEGLSSLVESFAEDQRVVPNMDSKTLEMLLTVPIRDFNSKTKAMKIDSGTLQHLKACRKRRKNRDAAIRSRSRKEQELVNLRSRVELLQKENDEQKKMIVNLLARTRALESKS